MPQSAPGAWRRKRRRASAAMWSAASLGVASGSGKSKSQSQRNRLQALSPRLSAIALGCAASAPLQLAQVALVFEADGARDAPGEPLAPVRGAVVGKELAARRVAPELMPMSDADQKLAQHSAPSLKPTSRSSHVISVEKKLPISRLSRAAVQMPFCQLCGSKVDHELLSIESEDEAVTKPHVHVQDTEPVPVGGVQQPQVHVQDASEPVPVGGVQQPGGLPGPVGQQAEAANEPMSSPPSHRSSGSSGEPTERRPRMLPSALRRHEQRLIVRRAMICQVPGISRVRAEAIVNKYPTLRALMNAPENELASLLIKSSPLGPELATALKRVFG